MDSNKIMPEWIQWHENIIEESNTSAEKIKYVSGIKDLQLDYKKFESTSIYVSKPFVVDGNIIEINLHTDEVHPMGSSSSKAVNRYDTAIEYYVCFKETFDPEDTGAWRPILPTGQDLIENEVLFFNQTNMAKLRFQLDNRKEVTVYKNGVRLHSQYWSYGKDNTIRIDKRFDKYSIYTIKYHPDLNVSSPWDIELLESDRNVERFIEENPPKDKNGAPLYGEVFTSGTDRNGSVVLSKMPYIDYSKINTDPSYRPIEAYLMPAAGYYGDKDSAKGISGPNRTSIKTEIGPESNLIGTMNITDYKYNTESILSQYETAMGSDNLPINPFFEFYQSGRRVYFTETFNNTHIHSNLETNHGDADIRIRYDYLKTSVRLKIILRNTSNKDDAITPVLRGYDLVFKVMR